MSGVLRLGNTGAATGRSTLQATATSDATFSLPSTGGTILTTDFDTIGNITWNGSNINITNADLNVDNGTLFVDESTNRVGIGTASPSYKLHVTDTGAFTKNRSNTSGIANCALAIDPADSTMFFGFRVNQTANDLVLDSSSASDVITFGPTGTANFGGLDLSLTNNSGVEVRHTGEILIQRPSSQGTSGVLDVRLGNTQKANILANGTAFFDGHVGIGQAVVSDNQLRVTSDSVYNIVANSARPGGATTDHNFTGLGSAAVTSSILARGTTSIHHLYDNRDDAALNVGYYTASTNTTKRTAAFFTAKGALYLGDNGDTTTSNFKTKLGSDGTARLISSVGIGSTGSVAITPQKKLHVRDDSDDYPLLVQNRTNAVSTCGIALIATGSDFNDGQYATIEALSGGIGSTQHELRFRTCTTGGAPAERIRILANGGLTFNGDTAQANALDDYEEGNFTMGITGAGSPGSLAYSHTMGRYVKIGSFVFVSGYISVSNKGSHTSSMQITGLPFTVANNSTGYSFSSIYYSGFNLPAGSAGMGGYPIINTTNVQIVVDNTNSSGSSNWSYANTTFQLGAFSFMYAIQ